MQAQIADNFVLLLLLVVALVAAWLLGRRSHHGRGRGQGGSQDLSHDYFVGLNYLLKEEPDDAIDSFINALEVNSSTLEMHMALGTLLRRRGKVDKSILVYHRILERPHLNAHEVNPVKVELVRSYIAAGLLDRAEGLLDELKDTGMETRCAALSLAIQLFQLEREWQKAVTAARQLLKICPARERPRHLLRTSHFYCELAEEEIERHQYVAARKLLKRAYQYSRGNVRISLLQGKVELALGNYQDAIKALRRVRRQDRDFESETFIPLLSSYQQLGSHKHLDKFIRHCLEGDTPASVLLGIGAYLRERDGAGEAQDFILGELRRKPSLRLMQRALLLMSGQAQGAAESSLRLFHDTLEAYLGRRFTYQCINCGYEAKSLHWLCPSCAEWGEIRPIKGMIGE